MGSQAATQRSTQLAELLSQGRTEKRPLPELEQTSPDAVKKPRAVISPTKVMLSNARPEIEKAALMHRFLEENLQLARQIMQLRERLDMSPDMIAKLIELEQEKSRSGPPVGSVQSAYQNLPSTSMARSSPSDVYATAAYLSAATVNDRNYYPSSVSTETNSEIYQRPRL